MILTELQPRKSSDDNEISPVNPQASNSTSKPYSLATETEPVEANTTTRTEFMCNTYSAALPKSEGSSDLNSIIPSNTHTLMHVKRDPSTYTLCNVNVIIIHISDGLLSRIWEK